MLHDDELPIDLDLVRALVADADPVWREVPLRPLAASGSTNALFRLGDELLVRLPRQPGGTETIEKEARWAPLLAATLPVQVPVIVHVGEPGHGYPERWSIVRWIDGATPTPWSPNGAAGGSRPALAAGLAAVLAGLRNAPVPPEARDDPTLRSYRAEPLEVMADQTRDDLEACRELPGLELDVDQALRVWDEVLEQQSDQAPDLAWVHGDLLAENLLEHNGDLAAVLDFGGLAVGDPSVDLIALWELFGSEDRTSVRRTLDVDDAPWARGRGWALAIAAMTFPYYWTTMPGRCAARLAMLRNVLLTPH
ncbi:MAG: phosphotransferase [Actinomycetales bacterium]